MKKFVTSIIGKSIAIIKHELINPENTEEDVKKQIILLKNLTLFLRCLKVLIQNVLELQSDKT